MAHALLRAAPALLPALDSTTQAGVEMSLDTARRSTCATSARLLLNIVLRHIRRHVGIVKLQGAYFQKRDFAFTIQD